MKGQPEPEQDIGLGKKVEEPEVIEQWYAPTNTPGVWRNVRTGKMETFIAPPPRIWW